ncbi:MAG: hypothetical protein JW779_01185 [Candidatus Thorarchaeota archaeon]|nr:hypothetical protein [Candidatus Thorarchaeota archaeon]
MNNKELIALLITCMVIAGMLGYILAIYLVLPRLDSPSLPLFIPPLEVIHFFVTIKTIVSLINMSLIFFTLAIYIDIYRSLKTRFTLGLVTMLLLLLLYALTSNPMVFSRFGYQSIGLGPFSILPDLFTTVAMLILFYLSLE